MSIKECLLIYWQNQLIVKQLFKENIRKTAAKHRKRWTQKSRQCECDECKINSILCTDPERSDGSVAYIHIALHKHIWNSILLQCLANHRQHPVPLHNTTAAQCSSRPANVRSQKTNTIIWGCERRGVVSHIPTLVNIPLRLWQTTSIMHGTMTLSEFGSTNVTDHYKLNGMSNSDEDNHECEFSA